ncbi:neural cell adhesion molecule 1-like isoform X2 [Dreissena polymorpha]|uniref:neural cell adhesion molecule 1-like isoform X2 n=1 Tax=Dreissena polymorpha TaxID=45954 RepID=UPI0022650F7D|nr:neural cell adhesion molecule 1-like isoform X2 [Dreissena polymorpha]
MKTTFDGVIEGNSRLSFNLDVLDAADIKKFYAKGMDAKNSIIINESQTVTLICEVDGDPVPTVSIINNTRGGLLVLTKNLNKTISTDIVNARCEYDSGMYQCRSNNEFNMIQQAQEVEVKVACTPKASPFSPSITNVSKSTNDSATLTLTMVAYPLPIAVTWQKQYDDQWVNLEDTSNLRIYISYDKLRTDLTILKLQPEDFGTYMVRVDNRMSYAKQEFHLFSKEKPCVPGSLKVQDGSITDRSFTVAWKPNCDGGSEQWFVVRYKLMPDGLWRYGRVPEGTYTYTLNGLAPGSLYDMRLFAENAVGKSGETEIISVTTLSKSNENDIGSSRLTGAALGGIVSGISITIIMMLLWRFRNKLKVPSRGTLLYDYLTTKRREVNVATITENDDCDVGKLGQMYETLAETSFHEDVSSGNSTQQENAQIATEVFQGFVNHQYAATCNGEGLYENLTFK